MLVLFLDPYCNAAPNTWTFQTAEISVVSRKNCFSSQVEEKTLSGVFRISALLSRLMVLAAALFAIQKALFGVLKALFPVSRRLLFLRKTKTIFFLEKRVFPKQRLNFH